MNLSIQDGRAELWQWDTGVRLVMDEACEAVNLSEDTFGVTVDVTAAEDGKTWVAAVPDEMLQKPGDLICYAVHSTATGTITAAYRSFRVNRRPKPAGYVATPTEARTWQELDDKKIDAPQTAQVGEVLTVEEVDEDGKPTKWKTAPGIRGEKGDTGPAGPQGETGPAGPKGADGKDGAGMDVTGAKVGQIAKITAVDSAGKPTAWEPVDMSEGDSGGLRNIDLIIDHIVTAEEVTVQILTWNTTTIPELGKYNLFYAVISSQKAFAFNKWVKFYINNGAVAEFSGTSSPQVKKLPISVNRYFGRWIGTNVYTPINNSLFPLIVGEGEMNLSEAANNTNVDATSLGIGSYLADFGLTEGMSIKIYAMV